MYGHELKAVLESLVDALPDPFRVVFVMREVEGLSTAETAASLSINEDTVKTRLHRAKRLLRDQLDRGSARRRRHLSIPSVALRSRGRRRDGGDCEAGGLRCCSAHAADPERVGHPPRRHRRDA